MTDPTSTTEDIAAMVAAMRAATDSATDADLRESLQRFGWVPEFPAIEDENGVTLVGNRRKRIAAELGIPPCVKVLTIGEGEAADVERLKLAFVSNIGGKTLTPEDRKRWAIYLYQERGWTQKFIATALGVNQSRVSENYLRGLSVPDKPPSRPKGGRPKSPPKPEPVLERPPPMPQRSSSLPVARAVFTPGATAAADPQAALRIRELEAEVERLHKELDRALFAVKLAHRSGGTAYDAMMRKIRSFVHPDAAPPEAKPHMDKVSILVGAEIDKALHGIREHWTTEQEMMRNRREVREKNSARSKAAWAKRKAEEAAKRKAAEPAG